MKSRNSFIVRSLLGHSLRRGIGILMMTVVVMTVSVADAFSASKDKQSVRDEIDRKIEKYTVDRYEKEIFPDCKKYGEMPTSYDKVRLEIILQKRMANVVNDAFKYSETLSASYPEESEYILEKQTSFLESQQAKTARLMYPINSNVKDDGIKLDYDSVRKIYKELGD